MKYETPELTTLTPAINAIQTDVEGPPKGFANPPVDNTIYDTEHLGTYMDWED
jgi:hypothetical protein